MFWTKKKENKNERYKDSDVALTLSLSIVNEVLDENKSLKRKVKIFSTISFILLFVIIALLFKSYRYINEDGIQIISNNDMVEYNQKGRIKFQTTVFYEGDEEFGRDVRIFGYGKSNDSYEELNPTSPIELYVSFTDTLVRFDQIILPYEIEDSISIE
jgi:hypothetical protein